MEPVQVAAQGGQGQPDAIRESNLPGHFEHPSEGHEEPGDDQGESAPDNSVPGPDAGDPQLDRALELLKSWNVFKTVVAQTQP